MAIKTLKFNTNSISASMASTRTGASVDISDCSSVYAQLIWSGGATPIGTFSLQFSADNSTFTDSATPLAVTGNSGSVNINFASPGAPFARIIYTRTSGTGTTMNGYISAKQSS